MASVTVFASFISVQSAKPSTSIGTLDLPPIKSGTMEILTRTPLPDQNTIPRGSVITSATYRVAQNEAQSGSVTLSLRRNLTYFLAKDTWNQKPSVVSTATGTQTKSSPAALTWWEIDVTSDVQGWLDKTIPSNWGWTLRTNNTTVHRLRGRKATSRHPHLVIEFEPPAKVPTALMPAGGAVSVSKPVLTFDTSDNTTAVQVQIDAAADAVSPDFDSGEVAGRQVDLAATAYAGLADGAATQWRARAKSTAGWSAWSTWVTFSRADIESLSLTAPGATPADSTPPFAWTFGGTQQSWQADLLFGGKVLRSSGFRSGIDDDWTATPLEGSYFGKLLTARIRVWDDVTRIATPGVPAYAEDSVDFTPAFTATVDPMDDLTASQPDASPGIFLAGNRAAGIPDEVAVFHGDVLVARLDGADVFTSGTAFAFTDWWARMGREVEISVVAIVDGEFADASPSDTITPHCIGLWLVEPATSVAAVLWGEDTGSTDAGDIGSEHLTVDGRLIFRKLANGPRTGTCSGVIVNGQGFTADDTIDAFETFRELDASTTYRLIRGQQNLPVGARNFLAEPHPLENLDDEPYSVGQFRWMERIEPINVDGG